MQRAWKRVKANKGSAGVDGLDIAQTAEHLRWAWPELRQHLLSGGSYRTTTLLLNISVWQRLCQQRRRLKKGIGSAGRIARLSQVDRPAGVVLRVP